GYLLCAIGTALMFGFRFPMNFESPFGSVGIAELWTRWHMSLASWMRDYVFTPLGGYRKGRLRGHVNLLITFVLVGLWHGAAWTLLTAMFVPGPRSALVAFDASIVAIAAGAAMVGAQIRYGHLRGWDWLETWSVTPRAIGSRLR